MEWLKEIAPILVGLGGIISAVFTWYKTYQAEKSSRKAAQDASMVKNFQLLYNEQKQKINELNDEMKQMKKDQAQERKQWADERAHLQGRIDLLTDQNANKDYKIAELTGMIQTLQRKVE